MGEELTINEYCLKLYLAISAINIDISIRLLSPDFCMQSFHYSKKNI